MAAGKTSALSPLSSGLITVASLSMAVVGMTIYFQAASESPLLLAQTSTVSGAARLEGRDIIGYACDPTSSALLTVSMYNESKEGKREHLGDATANILSNPAPCKGRGFTFRLPSNLSWNKLLFETKLRGRTIQFATITHPSNTPRPTPPPTPKPKPKPNDPCDEPVKPYGASLLGQSVPKPVGPIPDTTGGGTVGVFGGQLGGTGGTGGKPNPFPTPPLPEPPPLDPCPIPPVSQWATYTSPYMGISFKHPKRAEVTEPKRSIPALVVRITDPMPMHLMTLKAGTLDQFVKSQSYDIFNKTPVKVGGQKAYLIDTPGVAGVVEGYKIVLVVFKNRGYTMQLPKREEAFGIAVLKTLKFLPESTWDGRPPVAPPPTPPPPKPTLPTDLQGSATSNSKGITGWACSPSQQGFKATIYLYYIPILGDQKLQNLTSMTAAGPGAPWDICGDGFRGFSWDFPAEGTSQQFPRGFRESVKSIHVYAHDKFLAEITLFTPPPPPAPRPPPPARKCVDLDFRCMDDCRARSKGVCRCNQAGCRCYPPTYESCPEDKCCRKYQ